MINCDCGHSFEDHQHKTGLQCCKKCDCESAGITEMIDLIYTTKGQSIEFIRGKRGYP